MKIVFDKQKLLKSVSNQEERFVFVKVLNQLELCLKKHICTFTDFLDPAKVLQYKEILQYIKEDFKMKDFGGFEESERRIIAFFPDYMEEEIEFPIKAVKIKLLDKFSQSPSHREYLGSILGTGIERTKVGDILVLEEYAIAFIDETIADYVCTNLERVSRTRVENSIISLDEIKLPEKNVKQIKSTVASLRIDSLVSTAFGMSRTKASEYIKAEKVSLNWTVVKSNSLEVKEGDMITLRGHGRAKLLQITGMTKKDRTGVLIEAYL